MAAMKAIKKRPRNATPRKPVPKPKARAKAAPRKPAASARKKVEQRRLMIRFTEPGDVDWLGAQATRLGLGDGKGAGAATYAKMLIRAAHECSGIGTDPLSLLQSVVAQPRLPTGRSLYPMGIEYTDDPPSGDEPSADPVDVDDIVNEVANQAEPQRRAAPEPEDEPGRVRSFGGRIQRRPVDWGGR